MGRILLKRQRKEKGSVLMYPECVTMGKRKRMGGIQMIIDYLKELMGRNPARPAQGAEKLRWEKVANLAAEC